MSHDWEVKPFLGSSRCSQGRFRRFSVDEFFESAEPICGPINVKKETSQRQRPQTKTSELQAFPILASPEMCCYLEAGGSQPCNSSAMLL